MYSPHRAQRRDGGGQDQVAFVVEVERQAVAVRVEFESKS
jgi:hypothetical protein